MTATVDSSGSAAPRARAPKTIGHGAPFSGKPIQATPALIADATSGHCSTRGPFSISIHIRGTRRAGVILAFNPNQVSKAQLEIQIKKISDELVEASKWIGAREHGPFKEFANKELAVGGSTLYGPKGAKCWVEIVPSFHHTTAHWAELKTSIERCVVNQWVRHFKRERLHRRLMPIMRALQATPANWSDLPEIPGDSLPRDDSRLDQMALIGFPGISGPMGRGTPTLWETVEAGSNIPIKHGTPVLTMIKAMPDSCGMIYGYDEAVFANCKARPYMVCRAWARHHSRPASGDTVSAAASLARSDAA